MTVADPKESRSPEGSGQAAEAVNKRKQDTIVGGANRSGTSSSFVSLTNKLRNDASTRLAENPDAVISSA